MEVEERLIQLESKLIYAENTIIEMSKTIVSQNKDISVLKSLFKEINNKVNDLKDNSNNQPMGFDKPPHY